jgi:hypothetical protein
MSRVSAWTGCMCASNRISCYHEANDEKGRRRWIAYLLLADCLCLAARSSREFPEYQWRTSSRYVSKEIPAN